ncbi:hypothetical protein J1N35_045031 [Gossypium stocksii]|uniref:Uncharacterized protein n=1 Tax=Gossypium stocksii TaxID=47602 RepID=A0A9D3ZGT5_9ROSI|nr:hypothetical protein J1N35_045031 [Gossypium stocksii]
MGRSSPEMTPSHSDIEKGDVKHGVSSSQEKMTPENSDLANPPYEEEESTIIFKVPHRLREVNEKAYEPNVISIGPYHYRKPHLARMENFKKRWFKKFVEKPHLRIDQFRETTRPLVEKIRNCYEQPLHLDDEDEEEFLDMMVYDGCFVVQLIRDGHLRGFRKLGQHVSCDMRYDLLLLENQLPFFVLLTLYGMIEPNPGPEGHFYLLATSALAFFDKLINTSKDVELLRKSGIIDNLLGNDEAVTQMFNKLCNSIYYSPEDFYYNEIANQVNEHCKRNWNIWKAKLKKDYFHTPWSPISFLGALVLLLLTIIQTIFSILSYNQQRQLDY